MLGEAVVTWVENCALGLLPAVNRLVVAIGGPSGRPIDGVMPLAVWAVPMEIVACEGTNSGSLIAWARLKKICFLASELSEFARSAVL